MIIVLIFLLFLNLNSSNYSTQTKALTPTTLACLKPIYNSSTGKVKFKLTNTPDTTQTLGIYFFDASKKYYSLLKTFNKDLKKSVENYSYTMPKDRILTFFDLQPSAPTFESQNDPKKFYDFVKSNIKKCVSLDSHSD